MTFSPLSPCYYECKYTTTSSITYTSNNFIINKNHNYYSNTTITNYYCSLTHNYHKHNINNKMRWNNGLRLMESMATFPSGAGNIPRLNAVILGEALASEEDDLVYPSQQFSTNALVPSPQKVYTVFLF